MRSEMTDHNKENNRHHKPRKRIHGGRKRDAMAAAIKSSIPSLTEDVVIREIEDKAFENGCLTEDDRRKINKTADRKEQVRAMVLIIINRSYRTMRTFLDALCPVYQYIYETILRSFKRNRGTRPRGATYRRCTVCHLKEGVGVELVMDTLYSESIIGQKLYRSIHNSNMTVGQQSELWEDVLIACIQNNGIELLIKLLDKEGHYTHITPSLRNLLKNNYDFKSFCTCTRKNSFRRESKGKTFSKDSTTTHSPRESSDSVTSNELDIVNERETLQTTPASNVVREITSVYGYGIHGESTTWYDPLKNTFCNEHSSAKHGESIERENSEISVNVKSNIMQNQSNVEVKQQYVRMLSSSLPASSAALNSNSTTRSPRRFKSAVASVILKWRVVKLFGTKTSRKRGLDSIESANMCETEL